MSKIDKVIKITSIVFIIVFILYIIALIYIVYDFRKDYVCSTTTDIKWYIDHNCIKYIK